jgi:hypothetical protein
MHDPLTDRDLPWVGLAGGAEEDEARVGGRRRQVYRAWAGSCALDRTAVSVAPRTNSLLWLATATRGAGQGTT